MIRKYSAILSVIGLCAPAAGAQAPTWTNYAPLPVFNDTLWMRWPSIAFVGDTMVIAATFFPHDTTGFSARHRMSVVRRPGGPMRLPEGNFEFLHPQITGDGRGTLHLVWAEPRDSSFIAWLGAPISLWHSSYRNGRWSPARQLLTGNFLTWSSDARGIVCDSSGRLHIVLPAALPNSIAIVYFRINPSGEIERELEWSGGSYASITSLGGDSLVVAYATADSQTPRGGSAVFTRRSGDGGRTWEEPQLVTRSEKRNTSPAVVERSGAELHVLWIESGRFGDEQNQIRAFTAGSNGGWVEVSGRPPVTGLPIRLVSAGNRCGDYAVVTEIIDNIATDPRIHLVAFRVRDHRLFQARVLPELEMTGNVGLAAVGNSLRIVLSTARPGEETVITATASSRACAAM